MVAFNTRMPAGVPGTLNRVGAGHTAQQVVALGTNMPTAYGQPLVRDPTTGRVRGVVSGDAASAILGFLIRAAVTQGGATAINDPLGQNTPPSTAGAIITCLRRGFMMVALSTGSVAAAAGGQVYVRVGGATTGKPLMGLEAAADATASNTLAIPGCFFTGPADAYGNTEIEFNT